MLLTELYGSTVLDLIASAPLNELGPGRPNEPARAVLASLTPERLVAPHALHDRRMALSVLAGLWLRHDFFDESHAISQDLETPEGSYWHGILHRREPDYGNARYWMRLAGEHPIHKPLLADARGIVDQNPVEPAVKTLLEREMPAGATAWNPAEFVALCQRAARGPATLNQLVRRIQLREWELLFEHCFRAAAGLLPRSNRGADDPRFPGS